MDNKTKRRGTDVDNAVSSVNAVPANIPAPKSDQSDMQTKQTALQDALNQENTPVQTTQNTGSVPPTVPQESTPGTNNSAAQEILQNEIQHQSQEQPTSDQMLQTALQDAQTQQPSAKSSQVSYVDPNGQQQTGYIIDGVTYIDSTGTTPVPVGSIVTDSYGRQWYKGENGNTQIGSGDGAATPVNYVDESGTQHTGYLIGGKTYTDPSGATEIPVGSTVTTPDGKHWYKGQNGGQLISDLEYQRNLSDLSALINQKFDAADEAIKLDINKATQDAVDQLNRAMQDAQPNYEASIANQLLETKQAQDAQALRNQVNGDRGGIGSAQIDSIVNAGAKNREAIAAQQRQLASDTARQIADLRAQGKYQEAANLLQSSQQRLAALYNEQVRLQQEYTTKQTQLASLASTYMNAGIMPTDDMLAALGIDRATAQLYLDRVNGVSNGTEGKIMGPPTIPDKITSYDKLSDEGKKIANLFRTVDVNLNVQSNSEIIAKAVNDGKITTAEANFLRDALQISPDDPEWQAAIKKYMDNP